MNSELHIPYSDLQAQELMDANEIKQRKKAKYLHWASQACFFIGAAAAGLALLSYIKGNSSSNIAYVFIAAGLFAYKGFHYLWHSQLSDINIAEWKQDNGFHPLNDFELIELKRYVETNPEARQYLASWIENGMTIRRRDKTYLLSLIMDEMEHDVQRKGQHA